MKSKRRLAAALFAVLALMAAAAPAFGSQPPGQLGYEGHPGNQGGPQHHP